MKFVFVFFFLVWFGLFLFCFYLFSFSWFEIRNILPIFLPEFSDDENVKQKQFRVPMNRKYAYCNERLFSAHQNLSKRYLNTRGHQ